MPLKNLGRPSGTSPVDARLQAKKTAETLGKLPVSAESNAPGRFAGETSTKGGVTAAHQRVLGETGGPKKQSAALKGANAGLRFLDHGIGKTLKQGVLGALAGITLLGSVLGAAPPPSKFEGNVF